MELILSESLVRGRLEGVLLIEKESAILADDRKDRILEIVGAIG